MQQRFAMCAPLLVATVLGSCGKPPVSGIYTANGETKTALVQLVETGKGDVTGRMEAIQLKPDGSIADFNATITGLADGKSISLWLAAPTNLDATAVVEGDKLTLSIAGAPASGHYRKSDLGDFEKHASALRERSANFLSRLAAAADAEQQRETDAVLAARQSQAIANQTANQRAAWANVASAASGLGLRLDAFNARLDRIMSRIPVVEQQYRGLTTSMSALHDRWEAYYSGARGGYQSLIADGRTKSVQFHDGVERGAQSLERDEASLGLDIEAVETACAGAFANGGDPDASAAQRACAAAKPKMDSYRKKSSETSVAFLQLEAVYQTESEKQARLTVASNWAP